MSGPSYTATSANIKSERQLQQQHMRSMEEAITKLPSIHNLLQETSPESCGPEDFSRLSLHSNVSSEDEEMNSRRGQHNTLPPLNLSSPSQPRHSAARRLAQVNSHFQARHSPYPTAAYQSPMTSPALHTSARSQRSRRASRAKALAPSDEDSDDSEEGRTKKALNEKDSRRELAICFANLSRLLLTINPRLVEEWTPLKQNNIVKKIEDPLAHNKIDVMPGGINTIIDLHTLSIKFLDYLIEKGDLKTAEEVQASLATVGSNFVKGRPEFRRAGLSAMHAPMGYESEAPSRSPSP